MQAYLLKDTAMALEIYDRRDKKFLNELYRLSFNQFNELQDGLLQFESKTGLGIDPYSDTRLDAGILETLAKCIRGTNQDFSQFLLKCSLGEIDLILVGD